MPFIIPPEIPTLATSGPTNVIRYTGDPAVPYDIRDLRGNSLDLIRWMGTPVIVKHMFNDRDVKSGVATPSPNYSKTYRQTRAEDPISHGVGFVSIETKVGEWVSPVGELVAAAISPGVGYTPAPKYRGYGPGYLTYVIFPDVAEDVFKPNEAGVLIQIQRAQIQMGWYPEVNDNDLIIVVELDEAERVLHTHERFVAKQTNPASIHGFDQRGHREYDEDFGNRRIVNQSFELSRVPENHELYNVPTDR